MTSWVDQLARGLRTAPSTIGMPRVFTSTDNSPGTRVSPGTKTLDSAPCATGHVSSSIRVNLSSARGSQRDWTTAWQHGPLTPRRETRDAKFPDSGVSKYGRGDLESGPGVRQIGAARRLF